MNEEYEDKLKAKVKSPRVQEAIKCYVNEPVPEEALAVERLLLEIATQLFLGGLNTKRPFTVHKAVHDAKDMLLEARFYRWKNGL